MSLTGNRLRDALQRRTSTSDLIREEGQVIVLHRDNSRQPDGAGGFYFSPLDDDVMLDPQDLFFSLSLYEPLFGVNTPNGFGVHEKFVLIGMPDADIKVGDWFFLGDHKYTVQMMHDDRDYQTKAEGEALTNGSDPS